ncbi:uncharacterized protein LOC116662781 isoform X4 [Camelus ferus]|uniref:Uncharacterized protein LOC116662781 isoform X4 n=1 Tax=Camelus ferus TaxID=419612 RepID=A0A8B8SSE2_CAMFR|nr:uncharacterized protein LOC116662781 isoform X4 [Camelus ferus]
MEIILELQQSAQPHNTEAGTQIDRQISQLVEGASGWQLWAIGCWTTIGKTEMEQGQKIAHFYATQPLLSHDLKEFYWDNCPNEVPSILSKWVSWKINQRTFQALIKAFELGKQDDSSSEHEIIAAA